MFTYQVRQKKTPQTLVSEEINYFEDEFQKKY